ncbi:MAG TPA: hypothetical protein VIE64_03750 [Solirubrobacterales bacterium]|jgi:hypothetical protein
MTEDKPVACSLSHEDLEKRLAAIAEIGAGSVISSKIEDGHHLLRFRSTTRVRQQLESIVAAEAKCCSFLDLSLTENDDELTLSIAAPGNGQSVADALAGAFTQIA